MSEASLPLILQHARVVHGGSPAAKLANGDVLTYAELGARVEARAAQLVGLGLAAGDRVAIVADNGLGFLEATFATAWIGAVLVPINTRLAPREIETVLADSAARLCLHDRSHGDRVRDLGLGDLGALDLELSAPPATGIVAHESRPEDLCHLYYTSGTTGRPKGVILTQRNLCTHALMAIAELGLDASDVWAHVAPQFHLADAWANLAITWVGGRHAFLPRFEAEGALDLFERESITISNLVPTMLNRMVHHEGAAQRRFPALRRVLSGGAPIAPEVVRSIEKVFRAEYVQTYGMTETSPYLTMSLLSKEERELPAGERFARRARTGRPVMGIELEVVGEGDAPVARDDRQVGEIRVRGAMVTPGYLDRPEETAAAIRGGWLYTGDLARVDARGSVQIVDRKKDMIVTGGENVYSTEVEAVLYECEAVLEAAVYGLPDEQFGERVCAAVVPKPGHELDAASLKEHCMDRLAGFKRPRTWRFLDELPRTGSGKIAKRLLVEGEQPGAKGLG